MAREILSMNQGWRFHRGDIAIDNYNVPGDKDKLYLATKTESSKGPGRRDYDDSSWRIVNLPHDYIVEGTPTNKASSFFGSLERPNAWYRKTFKLDPSDEGKHLVLHFEGVCVACKVHVNGIPAEYNYTGGVGFEVDITDVARFGEDVNVVSVFVDNSDFEGWYYDGGGIYRNVWLIKTDKVYVDLWGTYVKSEPVEGDTWVSEIETEINNIYEEDEGEKVIQLLSEIVDPEGNVVSSTVSEEVIPARRLVTVKQRATVPNVKRWDIVSPNLYTLKSTILVDGKAVDNYDTTIGFRTIKFTNHDGFFLNGRRVEIIGYGSHQDLTSFGIGITEAVNEYRMSRLKSMGFNLFRTAHNPHAPHLYDACDKLGLMCMDENRWFSSMAPVKDEVVRMLKRDRNHPSIIMWSLYNEENVKARPLGRKIFRSLAALVHQYDPSGRPAIGCDNIAINLERACEGMDIIGINHFYREEPIDESRRLYPDTPVFFSEIGLTPQIKHYYQDRPHMLGAVGFGGLPYRGEATWPSLFCGAVDEKTMPMNFRMPFTLIATVTDRFYWHKAYWTNEPVVKIGGHWTYDKPGEKIPVSIYTNYEKVELFLNGKSLGVKDVDAFDRQLDLEIPFEAGELKAVATAEGKEPLTDVIKTLGAPARIGWELENPKLNSSGMDTAIITLYVLDSEGNKLPFSDDYLLKFDVKKGGRFLGVGSPYKGDHSNWHLPQIRMNRAQAQVYVACDATADPVELEVSCSNFETVNISIEKEVVPAVPMVPAEDNRFIQMWYTSPALVDQPWPDLDKVRTVVDPKTWKYREISRGSDGDFPDMFPNPFSTASVNLPKESVRIMYYATSKVPEYAGEYSKINLVFDFFGGGGEVKIYGVGKAEGKVAVARKAESIKKEEYQFDLMVAEAKGFEPGDEVEIWIALEANNGYSGIHRTVHWDFE